MIRAHFLRRLFAGLTVVLGLFLIAPQALAQAKCELEISTLSQWALVHDPFGDAQLGQTYELQYVNSGRTPCVGRLASVSTGAMAFLESRTSHIRVPFTLRDVSNNNNVTPGSADRLTGRTTQVPGDGVGTGRIQFTINPPADLPAGRYTRLVTLQFVMPNGDVHAMTDVLLVLEVKPSLIIGLAGEFSRVNGTPVLNLGQITQDGPVPLNARIYVRSSSSYQVTVTSRNGGTLNHDLAGWSIPYGLTLGGQQINLGAPHVVTSREDRARVDDYPLGIQLRDVAGKRAGRYSDVINFTVTAI